jgi:hypothetical protein
MSRIFSVLERLLLPVAIVALVVSLGDLLGIFRMLPATRFPFLLLVVTLLTLGTAGVIQSRYARLTRDLAPVSGRTQVRCINEVIAHIDPNLRKVWGDDYFAHLGNLLRTAVEERRVEVDNFALSFHRLLRACPGATFLSTCSLGTSHLWTGREIARALADFIQAGGRVKQLFFVQNLEDEASVELRVVLDHLRKIGVCVQVMGSTRSPCTLSTFFFVEAGKSIAWEIPLDQQGRIGPCVMTADERTITGYVELFTQLWESPC